MRTSAFQDKKVYYNINGRFKKSNTHDAGSVRNLIKQKVLNPEVPIYSQNVLKLTGINDLPLYILGPITLSVPIVNLEDFEEQECYKQIEKLHNFKQSNNENLSSKISNNFLRTDNSLIKSCKIYNVTEEDRVECIKKLLRLDHLNQDEYEHVEKWIKNNADRFQIPGEFQQLNQEDRTHTKT